MYPYPILECYGKVINFTVASPQQKSSSGDLKAVGSMFDLLPKDVHKLVFVKLITTDTRGVTHLIASHCASWSNTETIYFVSGLFCECVCAHARARAHLVEGRGRQRET